MVSQMESRHSVPGDRGRYVSKEMALAKRKRTLRAALRDVLIAPFAFIFAGIVTNLCLAGFDRRSGVVFDVDGQ